MTAGAAIREIKQQTNYVFAYENNNFDIKQMIRFPKQTLSVTEAMSHLLEGQECTYVLRGRYIAITPLRQEKSVPVVKAEPDSVARTGDVYRKTDVASIGTEPMLKPEKPVSEPVVTETDTLPEREIPLPYSAYQAPRNYYYRNPETVGLGLKTNLLYAAVTRTPNLALEIKLDRKSTLEIGGSYNPWKLEGEEGDNKKLVHWVVRADYRRWTCERFKGHYWGAGAFFSKYNVGGYRIPTLFKKEYRYEGDAYGVSLTYGYHLPIHKRWGLDFSIGLGAARFSYDQFDCTWCSDSAEKRTKTYVGPTKAGVSLVFMIQ